MRSTASGRNSRRIGRHAAVRRVRSSACLQPDGCSRHTEPVASAIGSGGLCWAATGVESEDEGEVSNGDLNWIANYNWGIADDVLRDLYVRGKYRDVILPMIVLRRLDAVLEDGNT